MAITNTDLLHKWIDRNAEALNTGDVTDAWIEIVFDGMQTNQIHISVENIWERVAHVLHDDLLPLADVPVTADTCEVCGVPVDDPKQNCPDHRVIGITV